MSAFISLVKKDVTLMRFNYLFFLVLSFLWLVGGYAVSKWISEPDLIIPFFILFIPLHVLLMPILVITVLRMEEKTQLWLYNPQTSRKLLLAKLTAASSLQFVSQILLTIYGIFMLKHLQNHNLIGSFTDVFTLQDGLFMQLGMFISSLYLSVWVFFLWTVYHSLGKYPSIQNFRWLGIALIIILYNSFETLLVKMHVIQNHLFTISGDGEATPKMKYVAESGWTLASQSMSLPLVPFLYYTLLGTALFFLASWLLDKKVEV